MIIFILEYLFMFLTGAILGWVLEVFYRRYFGNAKKWINPGFLSGPYLPIYGTGICLLYIVSDLQIGLGLKIILFAVLATGVEYLTGLFFLKVYNTRLWDYSKMRFNLQGIIAPLYTIYWTVLGLFFYFIMYPYFYQQVTNLYEHLEISLFIGMFYGIAFVDLIQSFNVLKRLKALADNLGQTQVAIHYDQLKWDIAERFDELQEKVEDISDRLEGIGGKMSAYKPKLRRSTFMRPFSGDYNMKQLLQKHFEKIREERKERNSI